MTDERHIDILLIGGGIASAHAAKELREQGFEGSIALVTREQDPPYHRPPITKGYLQGGEDRDATLIFPRGLVRRARRRAADAHAGHVGRPRGAHREDRARERRASAQALIATGAMVRRLRVDGATRGNIHYLRALGNADTLRDAVADAERIVVVGGSYIATEVAASLSLLGKTSTIVMQEELPTERHFGPVAGRFVSDLLGGARHRGRRRGGRRRLRR